jgi:predicted O-methyltransferase YrrM
MARVWLNQTPREWGLLMTLLCRRTFDSILEIGTESGGSFLYLMGLVRPGGVAVSVSLGSDNRALFADWAPTNVNIDSVQASSHSSEARMFAEAYAPYDLIHIDGDHSLQGARADWEHYGLGLTRPGSVVIIHDIADLSKGVAHFWAQDIRPNESWDIIEFVDKDTTYNGLGVVFLR